MKYSMFIGRWQPWHKGHRWLIDQRLSEGKNVLICVREVGQDDQNPYNPTDVKNNVEKELKDKKHPVAVGHRILVKTLDVAEKTNKGIYLVDFISINIPSNRKQNKFWIVYLRIIIIRIINVTK